jgi:hypothetical protein
MPLILKSTTGHCSEPFPFTSHLLNLSHCNPTCCNPPISVLIFQVVSFQDVFPRNPDCISCLSIKAVCLVHDNFIDYITLTTPGSLCKSQIYLLCSILNYQLHAFYIQLFSCALNLQTHAMYVFPTKPKTTYHDHIRNW